MVTVEDVVDESDTVKDRERPGDELIGDEEDGEREGPEDEPRGDDDSEKVEELACRWSQWLTSEWYGDTTYYLLYGYLQKQRRFGDKKQLRKVRLQSRKYSLVDIDEDQSALTYWEVNRETSRYVFQEDVKKILHIFHDIHGHFSYGVVSRNLMGRYYWPGCIKDIICWCRSCEACQ